MFSNFILLILSACACSIAIVDKVTQISGTDNNAEEAAKFIEHYDSLASEYCHNATKARWDFGIDPSPANQIAMVQFTSFLGVN